MTRSSETAAPDLGVEQRAFVAMALQQWAPGWALAESGKPFPLQALGLSNPQELSELALRLAHAVQHHQLMTNVDWARALFLTECCWASSLVGLGENFAAATGLSDADALSALRRIQRTLGGAERARLLFAEHPQR